MHIYKAQWLHHDSAAVYSVHVHPDGGRFATGGNDCQVRVWSLRPLEDEDVEAREDAPRLLASLTNHSGGVNCVRWSPDGVLLASCGDDKTVLLWAMEPGRGAVFGGNENVENWTVCTVLRGHEGDVTGVCWSPDGQWVASCSTDNSIIVWGARRGAAGFGKELRRLRGHTALVNGLAFDPSGAFLASQGAGELLMWRTSDWHMDERISDYFVSSTASSFFYRPSWSPDARWLAVPHAMNGAAHSVVVLARGTGNFECAFLGHREPTTVTCFNPQLFRNAAIGENKPYTLVALASQDGAISVWIPGCARPVAVLVGQFGTHSITDMAWSPDGMKLMATSPDGTVLYAEFDSDELGAPVSEAERRAAISQHVKAKAAALAPDPMLASLRDHGQQLLAQAGAASAGLAPTAATARQVPTGPRPVLDIRALQTVTVLKNGQRRITPVLLDASGQVVLADAGGDGGRVIDVDALDDGDAAASAAAPAPTPDETPAGKRRAPSVAAGAAVAARPAKLTRSSGGGNGQASTPAMASPAAVVVTPAAATTKGRKQSTLTVGRVTGTGAGIGAVGTTVAQASQSGALTLAHNEDSSQAAVSNYPRTSRAAGAPSGGKKRRTDVAFAPLQESAASRVVRVTIDDVASVAQWLPAGMGATCRLSLEANSESLRLQLGDHTLWEQVGALGGTLLTLAADAHYAAIVSAQLSAHGDSFSLLVFHLLSGALAFPRMALPSAPAALVLSAAQPSHLLLVGCNAELRVWDLVRGECRLAVSATELGASEHALTRCELAGPPGGPHTVPVLFFSHGVAYAYDAAMRAWMCVHDAARFWHSDFQSSFASNRAVQQLFGAGGGQLARLQAAASAASTHGFALGVASLAANGAGARVDTTLYHLEHQFMAASLFHSTGEFTYWVQTYARQLVDRLSTNMTLDDNSSGPRPPELLRLLHLCNTLRGAPDDKSADALMRRAVLREHVLAIAATLPGLHPLVARYRSDLNEYP